MSYTIISIACVAIVTGGKGLNTLIIDYYLHSDGCGRTALGVTFFDSAGNISNNSVVCGRELRHPGFDDMFCIPFRTLTHEWSHSYGAEDFYELKDNNPEKCKGRCIMKGDYIDKALYDYERSKVWCDRCISTIQVNINNWK